MKLNPDIEFRKKVIKEIKENGGYCPCMIFKSKDTKCPCKDKREKGICVCGLYVNEEDKHMKIPVHVEICREGVELPTYTSNGSAGMDVRAAEDVVINPHETVIVKTGLKVAIPEGYEIQVRPRSGLSLNTPLRIANTPGTIDSDYRDEIGIIVYNASDKGCQLICSVSDKGNRQGIYHIKKGDRIAQLVLKEAPQIEWVVTDNVKKIGEDRGGGFGHTGTK